MPGEGYRCRQNFTTENAESADVLLSLLTAESGPGDVELRRSETAATATRSPAPNPLLALASSPYVKLRPAHASFPMNSKNGISLDNAAVAALPKHLLQFAVDQRYDDYTPVDHAVWRFIMRQNMFFLKEYAHKVYFQGLLETGISFERIPRISEMNDILGKIGWGAVAVDGFIPPAAFMEFQAYKVLVIACDMRQIHHIEYTPAPDIVHEAAGHAPIIVDQEYSRLPAALRRSGREGDAVEKRFRTLRSDPASLDFEGAAELRIPQSWPRPTKLVEERQKNLGEPSEMALLSRLHWWTVEYGLIGTLEAPKIYGAGLLSSIGESVSCLEPHVKKLRYSVDAAETAFDITTKQPQLFVCRDFKHLTDVLEEFARPDGLPRRRPGRHQQSDRLPEHDHLRIFLRPAGQRHVYRSADRRQKAAHLPPHHRPDRARLCKTNNSPGTAAIITRKVSVRPSDAGKKPSSARANPPGSNSRAASRLKAQSRNFCATTAQLQLITFKDCTAKLGDRVLFDPSWGTYDMAVGDRITSVFNGAADKDSYNQVALVPKDRTIKVPSDAKRKKLESLYQQVRDIRERKVGYERLGEIWETQQAEHRRRLAPLHGDFRNPRRRRRAKRAQAKARHLPEREKTNRQRQSHAHRMGLPPGHLSQSRTRDRALNKPIMFSLGRIPPGTGRETEDKDLCRDRFQTDCCLHERKTFFMFFIDAVLFLIGIVPPACGVGSKSIQLRALTLDYTPCPW